MQANLRMNAQELSKVSVIQSVIAQNITQVAAAKILGLSERQIHRLKKTYQRDGAAGLLSKKRGKPSNRLYSSELRNGHVITYCFIISLSKPSLNEPQSEKHSHSPAMLEFCLNRSI